MNRLVREAMIAAGFYKQGNNPDTGKPWTEQELKDGFYPQATVMINGKSYDLEKIAYWDANIFTNQLDNILSRQNPIIHDLFAVNALVIFNAVRMVNINSKQGFKGQAASGNELDMTLFMARQFYDPDSSTNKRSSWTRTISAAGSKNFFEGATAGAELTMGEEEAMVWLGFYNPALTPCVDSFQIIMNTTPFDLQGLDFDMAQAQLGDPIIPLREPWTLPPEQSAEVLAYYFQTGTDEMRPLGIWIKESRNLRTLTSP